MDATDRVTRLDDHVCGHYLGYACGDTHNRGKLDLSVSSAREGQLAAWLALIRDHALPWFEEAADPDRVADWPLELGWVAARVTADDSGAAATGLVPDWRRP